MARARPRFLRDLWIDPDGALPDNVVQVISISKRYAVGVDKDRKLYKTRILAVVEEELD